MKKNKYIAPILIVVLLCAYYIFFAILGAALDMPLWGKAVCIVLPLLVCAGLIAVLVQRVKEIKSGEEDDLNQY